MTQSSVNLSEIEGDYPLANTEAARMLSKALERAREEKGWSQRTVASLLNYKSSVATSHMALGRVPVPVDRALDFARLLDMPAADFVIAVIEQRHPELNIRRILSSYAKSGGNKPARDDSILKVELEGLAGVPLDELPVETIRVLREAVSDKKAGRRWMSISELSIVEKLRSQRPEGLSPAEVKKVFDFFDTL